MTTLTFRCTKGHPILSIQGKRVDRCPACRLGQPCEGEVKPIGKGSRQKMVIDIR